MRSNNGTDFIIVFRGFDLYENYTNINNLGIASKLGEGVPLGFKMGSRQSGPIFLPFHIDKYGKYTKFRNSFIISCCLVLIWKLPPCLKFTVLNKIAIFLREFYDNINVSDVCSMISDKFTMKSCKSFLPSS